MNFWVREGIIEVIWKYQISEELKITCEKSFKLLMEIDYFGILNLSSSSIENLFNWLIALLRKKILQRVIVVTATTKKTEANLLFGCRKWLHSNNNIAECVKKSQSQYYFISTHSSFIFSFTWAHTHTRHRESQLAKLIAILCKQNVLVEVYSTLSHIILFFFNSNRYKNEHYFIFSLYYSKWHLLLFLYKFIYYSMSHQLHAVKILWRLALSSLLNCNHR